MEMVREQVTGLLVFAFKGSFQNVPDLAMELLATLYQ
jgi:hypothetical protein